MKTINILLIALTLLTTISCRKKHTVTLQAQNLQNPADASHYAGMKYIILERGYFFSHKSKVIASGQLDANGRAVLDVKLKKNLRYFLGIGKPDNVCYTEITIEYEIEYNEENNITFNYAPCGYVYIWVNNINCEGPTDKLWFRYYYTDNPDIYLFRGYGNGQSWLPNTGIQGCANNIGDFYDKVPEVPAGNYTFEWHIERPSGIIDGTDYFTVTEGDTTTYLLEY